MVKLDIHFLTTLTKSMKLKASSFVLYCNPFPFKWGKKVRGGICLQTTWHKKDTLISSRNCFQNFFLAHGKYLLIYTYMYSTIANFCSIPIKSPFCIHSKNWSRPLLMNCNDFAGILNSVNASTSFNCNLI